MNFAQTWEKQAGETERLKESLRLLNDKIEEAKRKKNLLVAKQKRAQAQARIHETMAGLNDRSAFEVFDRMAEKIEETERVTAASIEVHEVLHAGDTLEKEFQQLSAGSTDQGVEWKLLALKEKMGMAGALPTGSGAQGGAQKSLKAGASATTGEQHVVKDAEIEEEA
jgi:phage shock protein A